MSALSLAKQLLAILSRDSDRLGRIDNYMHGLHDDPYMPQMADDEYRLIAQRSVSNWMPLLVGTPAQALYVDGFRGAPAATPETPVGVKPPSVEWDHWQRSRLDARQGAIYRGALTYGHAFALTEKMRSGKVQTKGLSALRTAALFEDPANDDTPYAALTVTKWPLKEERGKARLFDGRFEYAVTFTSLDDLTKTQVSAGVRHGATECPVTRFAASVDLDGRTVGVIEPMIALQNRINQTVFDLLIAQTYGSFKVRYATGMAPPMKMKPIYQQNADGSYAMDPMTGRRIVVDQEPELDGNGNPQPAAINVNAKRFLFAEDPDTNYGSLDETPLGGYIESIGMSIQHLAAISQTPPHHLLGQIANLSAEALLAAETALSRKIEEFRHAFGEAWERVFRLAGEMSGNPASAEDWHGEVVWRDMEQRSLAQAADALGKLKEQLGIPARGLWDRVPHVTQSEIERWEELADSEPEAALAGALRRATPPPALVA